jgi:adenylate cyclase class 2
MSEEIEAKMRLESPEAVRRRIEEAGAEPLGAVLERNNFFDTPLASLRSSDQGLRLRVFRPLRVADPDAAERTVMTHKGPRRPGPLKRREETELDVSDSLKARAMLMALGFVPTLSFEKKRESWSLEGCRVELDELPEIGWFVEVEGPDETAIERVRSALGLGETPLVNESYARLVSDHLSLTGSEARSLGFAGM